MVSGSSSGGGGGCGSSGGRGSSSGSGSNSFLSPPFTPSPTPHKIAF